VSAALTNESRWRLLNGPLVYVLAQVVISPILQMKQYIPEIQEELRKGGYPRFQEDQIQDVIFGPQPQTRMSLRWTFLDAGGHNSVVISNNFIVLETSAYQTFEKFAEDLGKVLSVVNKFAQISLVERIGLRYVNLIRPNQNELLDDYLYSGLLGLPNNREGTKRLISQYESRDQSDIGGEIIVRLLQATGKGFLPPDLEVNHLTFSIRDPHQENELKGILDIDHFLIAQSEFNSKRLVESIWQLHKWTKQAFEISVTPSALKAWGKEDIKLN
jgi:uncharacterized protein (TIGR04255 family)